MRKSFILFIFIFNTIFIGYCKNNRINSISIFGLNYCSNYNSNIDKFELSKMHPLFVKVTNADDIKKSDIENLLKTIEEDNTLLIEDFRIKLIVSYSLFLKKTYFIGVNGIMFRNKKFKPNSDLLLVLYSYFPDNYFVLPYRLVNPN